jgi:16S rRNA (cytosine967-C5)-methyltransferase
LLRDRDGDPVPVPGEGPTAQLWPHLHDSDGMFLALVRRT